MNSFHLTSNSCYLINIKVVYLYDFNKIPIINTHSKRENGNYQHSYWWAVCY